MDRQRIRVIRARLEPLAKGIIRDGNEAIKTLAAALLELTESPHEDAVADLTAEEFRRRVDAAVAASSSKPAPPDGEASKGDGGLTDEERQKAEQIGREAAERHNSQLAGVAEGEKVAENAALDSRAIGDEALKREVAG